MWKEIESTHPRVYTTHGIQRHVWNQRSIPRTHNSAEDVGNLNSSVLRDVRSLNVFRRWRVKFRVKCIHQSNTSISEVISSPTVFTFRFYIHFYCLSYPYNLYWLNILSTVPWNVHIMKLLILSMLVYLFYIRHFLLRPWKALRSILIKVRRPSAFQLIQYVKQHESSLKRETANY